MSYITKNKINWSNKSSIKTRTKIFNTLMQSLKMVIIYPDRVI